MKVSMSPKLIIVADSQRFKVLKINKDSFERESLELLESIDSINGHKTISEKLSDQHGNFETPTGNFKGPDGSFQGANSSGFGENHNIEIEWERRRIKEIAEQISEALQKHIHDVWYFAAPKAINNQIVELLDEKNKKSMKINLHSDLTKIPNSKLLEYFTK
jgi:hypothetical protein